MQVIDVNRQKSYLPINIRATPVFLEADKPTSTGSGQRENMMKPTLETKIGFSKKASPRLKSLKPAFEELASVHQRFIDDCGVDYWPYWYTERPQIGFLAAAIWKCDGVALEEYSMFKKKQGQPKRCRGDLYLKINKTEFECEAKHFRVPLAGNSKALADKVSKGLESAVSEFKKSELGKGLALCFLTPQLRKLPLLPMQAKLRQLRELVCKNFRCDAWVWIGIPEGYKPEGEYCLYPGLLLIIREVK